MAFRGGPVRKTGDRITKRPDNCELPAARPHYLKTRQAMRVHHTTCSYIVPSPGDSPNGRRPKTTSPVRTTPQTTPNDIPMMRMRKSGKWN